eukprot:CAMPEP_0170214972 /NCGR_PEP_ID=MMETSP0116_2-20130129/7119_1 /TAXON_ID=400756 /ORGANISM="Durinskia baltica, Strain CSIRO CS-38" /LENGTH=336 /DNA_ID=CAMNT_0010465541 /DNA_START=68 /DNA_END=1075 /DNA_ORIENTATION=+
MSAECLLVRRAAETVAGLAVEGARLLTESDPFELIAPHVVELTHLNLAQASSLLLHRFAATAPAAGRPPLDALAAAVERFARPALTRLEHCIAKRSAFQVAQSLTPLLHRAILLASQCCCVAVRDAAADTSITVPLSRAVTMLGEVTTEAVLDRAEHLRPLDSSRIFRAHQAFSAEQAEISRAAAALLDAGAGSGPGEAATAASLFVEGDGSPFGGMPLTPVTPAAATVLARALAPPQRPAVRALAPAPELRTHTWRNDEMRKFWQVQCMEAHGLSVPIDRLALLLLNYVGVECTMAHREAMMKRLSSLPLAEPGCVAEAELDGCCAEARRCGGLR